MVVVCKQFLNICAVFMLTDCQQTLLICVKIQDSNVDIARFKKNKCTYFVQAGPAFSAL